MSLVEKLLARAGYVKLSDYGMVLTEDGRIVPDRPALQEGTDVTPALAAPAGRPPGPSRKPAALIVDEPAPLEGDVDAELLDADLTEDNDWEAASAQVHQVTPELTRAVRATTLPPPLPRRRRREVSAYVPMTPTPRAAYRSASLPPLPRVGTLDGARPARAPSVAPVSRGHERPSAPRLARGTAPVPRDQEDTGPMPTVFPPAPRPPAAVPVARSIDDEWHDGEHPDLIRS